MKDLIDRLEKATGPDRELDLTIHLAVYPNGDIAKLMQYPRGFEHREGMAWDIHRGGAVCFEKWTADGRCTYNGGYPLPAYTASIDAALTLVPEGWYWSTDSRGCTIVGSEYPPPQTDYCAIVRDQANPAIALCVAALKARSAVTPPAGKGEA